jgi:hypothetical protein
MELNRCTGSKRAATLAARNRRATPPTTIRMPAEVVPYLRRGVRQHLADALTTLSVEFGSEDDDPALVRRELARFDDARALLEAIGLADRVQTRADIEIVSRCPRLVWKVLRAQHRMEVERLEDAAAVGFALPSRGVPALADAAALARKAIDISLHRPPLPRRVPRRRGAAK